MSEQQQDEEIQYVRLDSANLTELRMAAIGAISALQRHGGCDATVSALKRGLRVTEGAYVDELVD